MSESPQTFVAPLHVQSGAWWASSHGNARRTALGALRDALAPAPLAVLLAQDARDQGGDQEAALREAGAALIVRKPVTAAGLVEALAALLEMQAPDDHDARTIATV